MSKQPHIRGLVVLMVSLVSLTACNGDDDNNAEVRGKFGPTACAASARVPVPSDAVSAVYFDINGDVAGGVGEDLKGTEEKKMCPTPPSGGGGVCNNPGYCPMTYKGKTICIPCN